MAARNSFEPSGGEGGSSDEGKDASIAESFDTRWTESTDVPRRQLGVFPVASLMINQMVGTGIFTTPAYVLLVTKSKPLTLGLFVLGGVYNFISAIIYLEYSTALPFNGGPLIWLDETFHRPALLASITFSVYWILLATSGNSGTFAKYAIQLSYPTLSMSQIDHRWIKILTIAVQGIICLALYFARTCCFLLNSLFALFKILFILVLAIAGFVATRHPDSGTRDYSKRHAEFDSFKALAGMIHVIYTYEGWEYTNFIAGEIKAPKETLRKAMFLSIGGITILYTLVTSAYFAALPYEAIEAPKDFFGLAKIFAERAFGSSTGVSVAVAISALSNAVAITYAVSKVKQAIAWQRFIPFAKFFGRQSRQFGSPGGALLLHWIVFTLYVIAVPSSPADSSNFASGTFDYPYEIMMVFLGLGLLRLQGRMRILYPDWRPTYLTNSILKYATVTVFIGLNMLLLVVTAMPHSANTIPRFYWAVMVAAIFAVAGTYWLVLKVLQTKIGKIIGIEVKIHETTDEDSDNISDSLRALLEQAEKDGSRRRLSYKITGPTSGMIAFGKKFAGMVAKFLG